ncbi:30S ribosomal protein S10 [Candidatus Vidania fulgoroideorum]
MIKRFVIKFNFESLSYKILNFYIINFLSYLKKNFISYKGPFSLPLKIKKFDILRSPHKDKDSRDQFEIRTYKKIIYIYYCNNNIFNKIMSLSIPSCIKVIFFLCNVSYKKKYFKI